MLYNDELLSQLRKALAHINDPFFLETLPLAAQIELVEGTTSLSRGQSLQRALRKGIDQLAPGASLNGTLIDVCAYEVLYYYAISRKSMTAIADQLGLSERQAYRELRKAIGALAQIMTTRDDAQLAGSDQQSGSTESHARVEGALGRLLEGDEESVDIVQLIEGVVDSIGKLARTKGIDVNVVRKGRRRRIVINRVMLRQAVMNLLSWVIGSAASEGAVSIVLCGDHHDSFISVRFQLTDNGKISDPAGPYAVAERLFALLGLQQVEHQLPEGICEIKIHLPPDQEAAILMIEDNEDLVALFRAFLRQQPYRLISAQNLQEARDALTHVDPDVIILDIVMPDQDGWEILQSLRSGGTLTHARLVVCSVINDPKLSTALGADAFLHKPVSRVELLQTLREVLSVPA